MAIVGPRPEDWEIVREHYTAELLRSLEVRPGIASPVDVEWYPDLTFHDPPPRGVSIQEHYLAAIFRCKRQRRFGTWSGKRCS